MPSLSVEYEFVKIPLSRKFFQDKPKEDYRKIIEEHGRRGWRLVQIFAPGTSGHGAASYFELIFERPA
jgi:Domain of unknown function (DUF4177)